MRVQLAGLTVSIDRRPAAVSTTVGIVGADVIAFSTALPDHALALTSSCLLSADGRTIAISQRHSSRVGDRLAYREHRQDPRAAASLAGVCLLEHAVDLRSIVATHTAPYTSVNIDVAPAALEAVGAVWATLPSA